MAEIFWPFDTDCVTEWPGGYSDIRYGVHMGTDFGVPQGTELRATTSGTITRVYMSVKDGWGIDITNDDGIVIRNWHMSRIDVTQGQWVEAGQIIGLTGGATGTPGAGNSTGPHLHWELRTNSNFSQNGWLDPRNMTILVFGQTTTTKGNKDMLMIHKPNGDGQLRFAIFGTGFWLEFVGQDAANGFARQIGAGSVEVSESFWTYCKKAAQAPIATTGGSGSVAIDASAIAKAVNDDAAKRLQG